MAPLVLLFLKFPLHVKGGSQWQIQVLKKGRGGESKEGETHPLILDKSVGLKISIVFT